MPKRPDLAAYSLTALIVVAAAVLSTLDKPIPTWFELLAFAVFGGAVGASIPGPVAQLLERTTGAGPLGEQLSSLTQDVVGLAGDLQGHLAAHTTPPAAPPTPTPAPVPTAPAAP